MPPPSCAASIWQSAAACHAACVGAMACPRRSGTALCRFDRPAADRLADEFGGRFSDQALRPVHIARPPRPQPGTGYDPAFYPRNVGRARRCLADAPYRRGSQASFLESQRHPAPHVAPPLEPYAAVQPGQASRLPMKSDAADVDERRRMY